jgi:chaperonin cofactor prefoldin
MANERLGDMEKEINPLEKEVEKLTERIKVLRAELRNKVNTLISFFVTVF